MPKYVVGLIGYGYWGPNLLRNFASHPQVEVKWVSDLSVTNLAKATSLYPSLRPTTDYREVYNDPFVDAVVLAVPTKFHFELARQALLAGKHVLVEKPMTQTVAEAKKLVAIAKKTKRHLCVDHPFVFAEAIKKMKSLIESGAIGQLHYLDSLRLNLGLIQPDINVIHDLAPHDFSILDYLLDGQRPRSLTVVGSTHVGLTQVELAHLHLIYPKGVVADITLSWLSPLKVRQMMVVGSKAMISYDDTQPSEKIRVYDKNVSLDPSKVSPFKPIYRSGDILIPHLPASETLYNVVESFVKTLEGKVKPVNDGQAGLRVVTLIEQAQQSLRRGQRKETNGTRH